MELQWREIANLTPLYLVGFKRWARWSYAGYLIQRSEELKVLPLTRAFRVKVERKLHICLEVADEVEHRHMMQLAKHVRPTGFLEGYPLVVAYANETRRRKEYGYALTTYAVNRFSPRRSGIY